MPNPLDMSAYGITQPDGTIKDSHDGETYTPDQWQNRFDPNGDGFSPLVEDSQKDSITKWANANGYKLSTDTVDYIYNQFFTEKNNETAWQRTLEADNTKYQRAVNDLKAAGINPIQVLGGYGGNSSSAPAGSVGSGSIAQSLSSKRGAATDRDTKLMQIMGLIGAALIYTLIG